MILRKLTDLAHELSEQRDELGLDEETLIRIFETKAEALASQRSFTFD